MDMDEFPGLLTRDFGFKSQGKSTPMAALKVAGGLNFRVGSGSDARSSTVSSSINGKPGWNLGSFMDDHDELFGSIGNQSSKDRGGLGGYDDVFGGPPKYASAADGRNGPPPVSSFDYDLIFRGSKDSATKSSSLPVFDKPVYDDDGGDLFNGVPGLKSSASVKHDDVFSFASSSKQSGCYDDLLGKLGRMDPELRSLSRKKSAEVPKHDASYDDLLGNLGKVEPESKSSSGRSGGVEKDMSGFDDLILGFGGSSPLNNRKYHT